MKVRALTGSRDSDHIGARPIAARIFVRIRILTSIAGGTADSVSVAEKVFVIDRRAGDGSVVLILPAFPNEGRQEVFFSKYFIHRKMESGKLAIVYAYKDETISAE